MEIVYSCSIHNAFEIMCEIFIDQVIKQRSIQ